MGEAFKVPGDPHKAVNPTWPTNSSLYRLDPPYVDFQGVHTHAIVCSVIAVDGDAAIAVAAREDGRTHKFHAIAYQDGSPLHDSVLKAIGYEDVYDEEG